MYHDNSNGGEGAAMDVDSPAGAPLKRSSSAPMINENPTTNMTTSPQSSSSSRDPPTLFQFGNVTPTARTRRHSFSPHPGSPSVEHLRLTPRINQLRREESVDHINQREVGHEREIRNNMRNSQSLEDLRITECSPESPQQSTSNLRLIIPTMVGSSGFLDTSGLNSPSPTRVTSSGFQSPTRGPSRTVLRRSESPVLRPSPLSHAGKRKLDKLDDDRMECVHSPIKRHNSLHYPQNHLSSTGSPSFPSLGLLTTTTTVTTSTTSAPSPNSAIGARTTSPHLTGGSLSSGVRTPDDSLSSSGAEESQFSPASAVAGGVGGGGDYVMMTEVNKQRPVQDRQQQDHDMIG